MQYGKMKRKSTKKVNTHRDESTTEESPRDINNANLETITASRGLCARCLASMKYLVLIMLLPPFLNFAALHQEQRHLLPAGAEYDIGFGQKMFFSCNGTGTPAVLLDAPTGMNSDVWSAIVDQLAQITRVCVYDRAGLGFSDRPLKNSTVGADSAASTHNKWLEYSVERMADDVYRLVTYRSQQLEKPFIYVGAELGALVARFYANIYEGDVSDVVLIEPLVETLFEQDAGVWAHHWYAHILPSYQTMQLAAATGLTRLALMSNMIEAPLQNERVDTDVHMRQKYLLCQPRHLSSVVDEHHFINESFSQIQTLFMLKQFPSNVSVTVMTGNYYDEQLPSPLNKAWAKAEQYLLTKLHSNANHIVVNGADRHMLYRHPQTIVQQIRKLVKQRRNQAKNNARVKPS